MIDNKIRLWYYRLLSAVILFYAMVVGIVFQPIITAFFLTVMVGLVIMILVISLNPRGYNRFVFLDLGSYIACCLLPLLVFMQFFYSGANSVFFLISFLSVVGTGWFVYHLRNRVKNRTQEALIDKKNREAKPIEIEQKRYYREALDKAITTGYLAVLLVIIITVFYYAHLAFVVLFLIVILTRVYMMHYLLKDATNIILFHLGYITIVLIGHWVLTYYNVVSHTLDETTLLVLIAFLPLIYFGRKIDIALENHRYLDKEAIQIDDRDGR